MGLTILLQGQDITDWVDESTISIKSVLGQGQGVGGQGTGSTTTANFLTDLGPIKSARGAGQGLPTTYPQVVLSDSPVAYWRMDTSAALSDYSGNDQAATVEGGLLQIVSGATGDRNGGWETNGSVYVQTPLVLSASSGVTLECLVYLTDDQAYGPVVAIGDFGTGYSIGIGNGTDWDTPGDCLLARLGLSYKPPASPIHLPVNEWVHIVVTFGAGSATYYINSVNTGNSGMSGNTPTGHGYIGAIGDTRRAHNLVIDEVACYSTMLSPSRIAAHYGAISAGPVLVRGGEVSIRDATDTAIFGGWVNELEDTTDALTVHTQLDCVDYLEGLDRIEVNEVFTGSDDITIIRYIMDNYAPDFDLSELPALGTYPFAKRYIKAKSVKEALLGIATITGYAVWITPDKKLHYTAPTDVSTAPFSLSDDPDFVNSFGYDILQYLLDESGTVNRVYFYGGDKESPDFTQDLSVQANGSNTVFQLAYYPHDAEDGSLHVVLNGTELSVGSPFDSGDDAKLISDGGTSQVLVNRDSRTLQIDTTLAPDNTDTFTIRYRFTTPLLVVVSDRSSFAFYGRWYDGKLDDSSVLDADTAIQRARVLLSQQSYGLETLKVELHTGGLQAGQLLHIVNDLRALDDTYLIQEVDVSPEGAGFFKYTVSLGAWNWTLVDLLFTVAKRAGVQDDSTEEDTSVVQAQETLEGADVVDVITLTTTTTGQYFSGHFFSGFATVGG